MRSQLFGFFLPTKSIYETNLTCSLEQAEELIMQLIAQVAGFSPLAAPNGMPLSAKVHTQTIETTFNHWDEEIVHLVGGVLCQWTAADELLRMAALQEALSWRWAPFHRKAVIAQFYLSVTIEQQVNLLILIGWNGEADEAEIHQSQEFVHLLAGRFQRVGIPCNWFPTHSLIAAPKAPPTSLRQYGLRLDTAGKLLTLRQNREKERQKGHITSTRMAACDHVGLALGTFKKYDQLLYDRWYDVQYRGNIT